MPGLRRSTPDRLVVKLTERLAEEYSALPLSIVSQAVRDAVVTLAGPGGRLDPTAAGVQPVLEVVEHLAREDLDEARAAVEKKPKPRPASSARGSRAARPSGRRRGAASSS